jgi:hypothetical protein
MRPEGMVGERRAGCRNSLYARPFGGCQSVIKDSGVTDVRLLMIEPEFARMLKGLRRGETHSSVVRQAWDSGVLTAMTKDYFAKSRGTHVSILGHITRAELEMSDNLLERRRPAWECSGSFDQLRQKLMIYEKSKHGTKAAPG